MRQLKSIQLYSLQIMSRLYPYRTRMPVHILQLLDVASRITLFLVGQSGPLSFTFKDRLNQKYKTSIGAELKCSCSPSRNDHCIHTAYVMLKIFKVSTENPIIWQAGYVDSELSDLLSGKYTVATSNRVVRPMFDDNFELPSDMMLKKEVEKKFQFPVTKAERMKLNEDSICPICQQSMDDSMCLTYCRVKCGNNFHLQCLKVWVEHKNATETKITCPMCRQSMGQFFLQELEQQQREHRKKQAEKRKINFKCSSCGVSPIPHSVHKCIFCTSYQLCLPCYQANKHIKHPFIKQTKQDKWCGGEERRQSELKIKSFIQNKRKQKNVNQQLLEKLRKVEQDPNKILDYVAAAYPYVSKYISQNIDPHRKLGFEVEEMKCMKCSSKRMIFLRRLSCGHFIDHECLKECIRKEIFHCLECGTKILKGYQNLLGKQKQLNNATEIFVNEEFNPKNMERNHHHEEYNFQRGSNEEEPTLTDVLGGAFTTNTRSNRAQVNRMKDRLSNGLVRQVQRSQPPRSTQNNYNNSIRIRNISRSNHLPNVEERRQTSRRGFSNKRMGQMVEMMIGRKIG